MENKILKEPHYVDELVTAIRSNMTDEELSEQISRYHENDIAGALELLNPAERKRLYAILSNEDISEIFTYIEDADQYIKELDLTTAARIIENMDSDDAVDLLEEIDDDTKEKLVDLIDDESSRDIYLIQSYDDNEIGSKMTTNFILIPNNLTIKQAMRAVVSQAGKNDNILTIYVCDENDYFYGALDLKDLIIAREYEDLHSLISTSYPYVNDHEEISSCIERLKEYAEDSIPVLNEDGKILGIITAQDIVEVVDEEMGEDYAKLAGLTSEEDLHETTIESMKKRMPWLLVLLILGIGVSSVVGMFETVVSQIAIIVCFQSLILDMAGNVGTQSLAVTIRVLMDENLKARQKILLIFKEMRIGFCNGILLGLLSFLAIGAYICLFKQTAPLQAFLISGCVGVSLLTSMLISSLVGTTVPMFFHKINIDPAVASGPLITTVNDLVAVITYYGLSWILLINILHIMS